MEKIRTACEVHTGMRTQIIQIDFNTNKGMVKIGENETHITFSFFQDDKFSLSLNWILYSAQYSQSGEIKIVAQHIDSCRQTETVAGPITMQWVGISANERREEPLYICEVEVMANDRGLTVEQLINP